MKAVKVSAQTAELLEALKSIYDVEKHVLEAMCIIYGNEETADAFMQREFEGKLKDAEDLIEKLLVGQIGDNILTASGNNTPIETL